MAINHRIIRRSAYLLSLLFTPAFAQGDFVSIYHSACVEWVKPGPLPVLRKKSEIKTLRVATYNTLNLYLHVGKFDYTGPRSLTQTKPSRDKPHDQLLGIAKAITDSNPDIMVLQEIESLESLQNFTREYLSDSYTPILIQGNDPRGIQIGFLIKKDLPLKFELRSYRDQTWMDPTDAVPSPSGLFSRDYPALVVRADDSKEGEKPLMVLFGVHFKSKRDRPGDPQSNLVRKAQVDRAVSITRSVQNELGTEVPMFIAGDFNGASNFEAEYRNFWELLHFEDAFNVKKPASLLGQRITHTFHPHGEMRRASQLDAVLLSPSAQTALQDVSVYRYKDPLTGAELPVPATYDERDKNPSDHFLVLTEIDFQKILR